MSTETRYIYQWGNNSKRATLKGRGCRVLARGTMNSALVEFENGQREVISRNAPRKEKEETLPEKVKPVRLQRRRQKGAKLESPNGLEIVCVTRPGKWGNPFKVRGEGLKARREAVLRFAAAIIRSDASVPSKEEIREGLRGKNLACFCDLALPCHADVLLQIANEEASCKSTATDARPGGK